MPESLAALGATGQGSRLRRNTSAAGVHLGVGCPPANAGGRRMGTDRFALPEAARELRDDSGAEGIRHLQDVVMDRVVVADAGAIVAAELM